MSNYDETRVLPCHYCGTLLVGDPAREESTGVTHHVSTCREYVKGALEHTKREVTALRADVARLTAERDVLNEDRDLLAKARDAARARVAVLEAALRQAAPKVLEAGCNGCCSRHDGTRQVHGPECYIVAALEGNRTDGHWCTGLSCRECYPRSNP